MPVADGGDGTLDVLGGARAARRRCRRRSAAASARGGRLRDDGTAIVESAEPLGFQTVSTLDPLRASSRGLGELILAAAREADALLVCLGGTVTVDGGAGMREVLDELPLPTRVACDVSSPLLDAVYVFATAEGRARGGLRASWPSGCAACRTSRARARPAGSAARSPRSARSSCPARSSCSTRSASTRAATTSS